VSLCQLLASSLASGAPTTGAGSDVAVTGLESLVIDVSRSGTLAGAYYKSVQHTSSASSVFLQPIHQNLFRLFWSHHCPPARLPLASPRPRRAHASALCARRRCRS
jgi:hypothetical protein